MRFEDERYVRLYTRDTTTWLMLPWQSRLVFMELLRKVDRAGILDVGEDGLEGLAVVLRLPIEVVTEGLSHLIRRKSVEHRGTVYILPNFIQAQECHKSDQQRKREQRERARAVVLADQLGIDASPLKSPPPESESAFPAAMPSEPVTPEDGTVTQRDSESRGVTFGHEESRAVTDGHAESQPVTVGHSSWSLAEPSLDKTNQDKHSSSPAANDGASVPKRTRGRPVVPNASADEQRVFEHWLAQRAAHGKSSGAILTADRLTKIRQRLREGYSVDDLKAAIEGVWLSAFHAGENDRHREYTDIVTCLRDGPQVETFRDLAASERERNKPLPPRPDRLALLESMPSVPQADESEEGPYTDMLKGILP